MNDIEYVKWLVDKAIGFELNEDQLIFPEGGIETLTGHLLTLRVWKLVWFPLLLLRASDFYKIGTNSDADRDMLLKMVYKIQKESER